MVEKAEHFNPHRCAVIGSTGGIGSAFVEHLLGRDGVEQIYCLSRRGTAPHQTEKIISGRLDYYHPETVQQVAEQIEQDGPLDLVIVTTGILHDSSGFRPEKSLRDLEAGQLARSWHINAIGPMLVARAFLPLMAKNRKTVFAALSARVGSISDNRMGGWYGYRAAKAGLNQLLKTASIEHARRWKQGIVIGLHPGTVNTGLSQPFQGNVPVGKLFQPAYSAERLMQVIDQVNSADSGKVFAWDGSQVPA